MSIFNSIKTFFYGFIMRIKLGWYTRQKRKRKKFTRKVLYEKLGKVKLDQKTIEKITNNYLNIGEIFLDRKNLKAAFSFHRINVKKKNSSNN
ncbi:MAG: hypothetical protein GOP50_07000 [Candidatus Heimdallarchaeota archaeon]|nr:hypothetical protein [Candidatus Heimdallarchaeota archaeon]